jgi:hypothetical protein
VSETTIEYLAQERKCLIQHPPQTLPIKAKYKRLWQLRRGSSMVTSSELFAEGLMSHSTDGAEVLALWSNSGLTGRSREKRRYQPPRRAAAKGKRAVIGHQPVLNPPKLEGRKRQTS